MTHRRQSLYHDGEIYDLLEAGSPDYFQQQEDLNFWLKAAERYGGPILELGCGTGRISAHIASAGFQVIGIDISESMLGAARSKSSIVQFLQQDIRNFKLDRLFGLIVLPFNTLQLLTNLEQIESCLKCVRRHLQPDGHFIIDVHNPSPIYFLDLSLFGRRELRSIFQLPTTGETVVVTKSREYDAASQVYKINLYFKFSNQSKELHEEQFMRLFFPQELEYILHKNGFVISEKLGNYEWEKYSSDSVKQIVVCNKTK